MSATGDEPPTRGSEPGGEFTPAPTAAQPGHHRRRRWPRILGWTAGSLVIVLLFAAGAGFLAYRKLDGNITSKDITGLIGPAQARPEKVTSDAAVPTSDEAQNILLIGSDTREGAQNSGYGSAENITGARSDTTILLHLAADRKSAIALSIPRDSWVDLPSCTLEGGGISAPRTDRFNEAFAAGGPACTFKAVEALTGIRLDHYMVIDFGGFKRMVNALGGVEVCLIEAVYDKKSHLDLPAGISTVDGDQALAFVRARYNLGDGSDLSRIDRQQAFLSSMVTKARDSNLLLRPLNLYQFLDAATKSVTTDPALGSLDAMRKLAASVAHLDKADINFLTVPNHYYELNPNVVVWDTDASEAVFAAIRADRPLPGTPAAAAATATPSPSATPSETPSVRPLVTPASSVRVRVLNGTRTSGAASRVAEGLRALGFQVVAIGNADRRDYASTTVRRSPAYDESGRTLLAAIPGAVEQVDNTSSRTLTLVLGSDGLAVATTLPAVGPAPSVSSTQERSPTPSPIPSLNIRTADQNICS